MSKKVRIRTIQQLNAMPSTVVASQPRDTLASFTKRWNEEQAAAEQAKIAKLLAPLNETHRQIAKAHATVCREFWGRPMSEIYDSPKGSVDPCAYDEGLVLADADTDGKFNTEVVEAALSQFTKSLSEQTGFALTRAGLEKLWSYGKVQAYYGKDLSTSAAWQACFDRLQECKAFLPEEVNHDATRVQRREPARTPERQLTTDDLLAVPAYTREGHREAIRIADELGSQFYAPLFSEWLESLRNNFGFTPSDEHCKKVVKWFQRNNLGFGDRRNYDAARRWMVANLDWPESVLTDQDRLNREIESTDLNDFEAKRNLLRRVRRD